MSRPPKNHTRTTPSGEEFESLRVYLPRGLKRQFVGATKHNGHTMSFVVTRAVREYVEQNAGGAR